MLILLHYLCLSDYLTKYLAVCLIIWLIILPFQHKNTKFWKILKDTALAEIDNSIRRIYEWKNMINETQIGRSH